MNIKTKIIPIIILLIFFILLTIVIIFRLSNNIEGYIIATNVAGFYCQKLECKPASFSNITTLEEKNRLFNVYYQNKDQGKYYLQYNTNNWNFFDENQKWTITPGDFLALSPSLKATVLNPTKRDYTLKEQEELKEFLKENHFEHEYHNVISTVYEIDLNNDQQLDQLYFASNTTDNYIDQYYFTTAYAKINNKISSINLETSTDNEIMPDYNLYSIFYLKKPQNLVIIINKNYFSFINEPSMSLYKIKNNKLEIITTSTDESLAQ